MKHNHHVNPNPSLILFFINHVNPNLIFQQPFFGSEFMDGMAIEALDPCFQAPG
jgi:hypothetical protein